MFWRLDAYETNPASSWLKLWNPLRESARDECSQRFEYEDELRKVSLGADHGGQQGPRTADGQTAARYAGETPKDHCNRPESSRSRGRPSQCTTAPVFNKNMWTSCWTSFAVIVRNCKNSPSLIQAFMLCL